MYLDTVLFGLILFLTLWFWDLDEPPYQKFDSPVNFIWTQDWSLKEVQVLFLSRGLEGVS